MASVFRNTKANLICSLQLARDYDISLVTTPHNCHKYEQNGILGITSIDKELHGALSSRI